MDTLARKAQAVLVDIESYLKQIAEDLPPVGKGTDLLKYISTILRSNRPQCRALRRAFGFPARLDRAAELLRILKSHEPSLSPLIRMVAQRVYQLVWRFRYTLHSIEAPWRVEALRKTNLLLSLCDPYLLARRPTPADLRAVLKSRGEFGAFRESAVDTSLFAVLRTFEYFREHTEHEEPLPMPADERDALKKSALDFLREYISLALRNQERIDDSSNAWWAVRVGIDAGDKRFVPLIAGLLEKFRRIRAPSHEVASRDPLPDIRIELRTAGYTLSNAQAMFENLVEIDEGTSRQLQEMIEQIAAKLVRTPVSLNLYLASVHYEALRNYLDYVQDRFLQTRIHGGRVRRSDFCPVGKFACADEQLYKEIEVLAKDLRSADGQGKRILVLVYGPSSTGKTFLVRQLFEEFGQGGLFDQRRVICSPQIDTGAEIRRVLQEVAESGQPQPFVFIDEADVELGSSFFPMLLKLYEDGATGPGGPELRGFVLFWGGGKCESVSSLRQFLEEREQERAFEKGIDVFNRTRYRIELPPDLLSNRSHKVAVGLMNLLERCQRPVKVDWRVVSELRRITVTRGAREIQDFAERLAADPGGVMTLPDGKTSVKHILVD